MIYEGGHSPYMRQDFGIGHVMLLPNYQGSPEDHAVCVTMEWLEDADEEEVDQRLETWLGLPCLPWFRFHLADCGEADIDGWPSFHLLHGYLDTKTALEIKASSTVYQKAYGERTPHDG